MEDLQTINDIINGAVKDSSYVTVLVSSGVFILYTLIIKLVDLYKSKDRTKPLIEMASAIKEISENVVKLNQVLNKTIQDAEIKETQKIDSVISVTFGNFKSYVSDLCIDIIVNNHVKDNKETIRQNLYKVISTGFYKVYSIFSVYEHDSINVATRIKEEWIDDVTNDCMTIICSELDSTTRIRQLNTKLTILSDEYSVYVKNKVFNH